MHGHSNIKLVYNSKIVSCNKIDLFKIKYFTIIKRSFSLSLSIENMMHDTTYLAITYRQKFHN